MMLVILLQMGMIWQKPTPLGKLLHYVNRVIVFILTAQVITLVEQMMQILILQLQMTLPLQAGLEIPQLLQTPIIWLPNTKAVRLVDTKYTWIQTGILFLELMTMELGTPQILWVMIYQII